MPDHESTHPQPPDRITLSRLGWSPFFETHFEPFRTQGLAPARVARQERDRFVLYSELGRLDAQLTGRTRHHAVSRTELPAVGDWVAVAPLPAESRATIHAVLPRRSRISRHQAGPLTEEQVIAANIDVAFLVSGLDGGRNFHLPTIQRYVTLAWESGAMPVVLLNKSDLCPEPDQRVFEVESAAPGVPVHAVSALLDLGLDPLRPLLGTGKTAVFLGRSGVGKSLLINRLAGQNLALTAQVRPSDREGRHTTTWREMILLDSGGVVIDTPGMREIQLWGEGEGLATEFSDIEALALKCKFRNCHHRTEPGCAVLAAIAEGALEPKRLEDYLKLEKEMTHLARKQDAKARILDKAQKKAFSRHCHRFSRHNPKNG